MSDLAPHRNRPAKSFSRHRLPRSMPLFPALMALLAGCRALSYNLPDIRSETIDRLTSAQYSEIAWSSELRQFLAVGLLHPSGESDLYIVDERSGQAQKFSDTPHVYKSLAWSPDNKRLAFTLWPDEVWVYESQSRELALVSQGEGAVWSPAGDHLAVYVGSTVSPPPANPQMRFVDPTGALLRIIDLGSIGIIRRSLSQGEAPLDAHEYIGDLTWSPTSDQIAFSLNTIVLGGEDSYEAFILDTHSETVTPFIPGEQVGPLAWSPTGSLLAYIRIVDDGPWGALVLADATGACLFVPQIPPQVGDVAWSHDGSRLAFLFHNSIHVLHVPESLGQAEANSGCE